MQSRRKIGPGAGPKITPPCIVMVCSDQSEAEQVGRLLEQQEKGCLATYRCSEDLVLNAPRGKVAVTILAGEESPVLIGRTLMWLRRRWPNCPTWVVGDGGDRKLEMAAREGGASFLVRPVSGAEWAAVIEHGMAQPKAPMVRGDLQRPI